MLVVAKDVATKDMIEKALDIALCSSFFPAPEVVLGDDLLGIHLELNGSDYDDDCNQLDAEEKLGEKTSHIFFTSGSTGRPKGCVIPHKALLTYCNSRNKAYKVSHTSKCFIASAHTFDPS